MNPIELVFLAEFDINEGSILKHSFPIQKIKGLDEHLLAEHMLPDGAHDRNEDWTIFYLNQIPGLTIDTTITSSTTEDSNENESDHNNTLMGNNLEGGRINSEFNNNNNNATRISKQGELLYVMSLVRTKKVASVKRGALVKALAVATRFPYIHIYKPILLLALDDYFNDPTLSCLSRLYTSINSMDLNYLPSLSLNERLILRTSDRKDLFEEKFISRSEYENFNLNHHHYNNNNHVQVENSFNNLSLSGGGMGMIKRDGSIPSSLNRSIEKGTSIGGGGGGDISEVLDNLNNHDKKTRSINHRRSISSSNSISSRIFSSSTTTTTTTNQEDLSTITTPSWRSTKSRSNTINSSNEGNSNSSINQNQNKSEGVGGDSIPTTNTNNQNLRKLMTKDTHWYESKINYNGIALPIKIPLGTFPEEIGDYSLIKLIQTFSQPNSLVPSPLHPHLHTSGSSTHPIILLFNALITNKRIIFLGHGQAASEVANLVLAACALGSGCGTVLGGFVERAFPYTNLTNLDGLQTVEGFIAGVCNPAFLNRPTWWDVLLNIETGKILISKDIAMPPLSTSSPLSNSTTGTPLSRNISLPPILTRSTTLLSQQEEGGMTMEGKSSINVAPGLGPKKEDTKAESADNYFMEEILNAIQSHYGESVIRARFTDYTQRFVRLASLYEEFNSLSSSSTNFNSSQSVQAMITEIGYPSYNFNSSLNLNKLGSGIVFTDEGIRARELNISSGRIEGWKVTRGYELFKESFQERIKEGTAASRFDLLHQISRLRQGRRMTTSEVELILSTLAFESRTEEGLLAILEYLPPHFGGLLPVTFGLFHPSEKVRRSTLDFLDNVNQSDTGKKFLQSLNAFHRSAYERQSKERLSQSFAGGLSTTTSPHSVSQERRPSLTSGFA